MKLTEKLKLKLFEKTDRVSYKPINENVEAIEAELGKQAENLTAEIAAVMTAMGSGGKTARVSFGGWTGNGAVSRTLTFEVAPVLLVILSSDGRDLYTAVIGGNGFGTGANGNHFGVAFNGGEVTISNQLSVGYSAPNINGEKYFCVAIGV